MTRQRSRLLDLVAQCGAGGEVNSEAFGCGGLDFRSSKRRLRWWLGRGWSRRFSHQLRRDGLAPRNRRNQRRRLDRLGLRQAPNQRRYVSTREARGEQLLDLAPGLVSTSLEKLCRIGWVEMRLECADRGKMQIA